MSARARFKFGTTTVVSLAALSGLWLAGTASASDADPFAGDTPQGPSVTPSVGETPPVIPGGEPGGQKQGPIAAPAQPAEVPPALVQQLPASAYPEPFIRGLYGGPLWLDMQGLQWPYFPRTGIGLSGYGWIDTDYKYLRLGGPNVSPHNAFLFQQGRFLLRVTPTYTNGHWFVQAEGEIVANKNQQDVQPTQGIVAADDVWVRTGVWQSWDVTVGRFLAFDVFQLGMGLDINTDERVGAYDGTNNYSVVPQLYNLDYMFGRPAGPGNVAFHLYPTKFLRFEMLGRWGNTDLLNNLGARPAGIFDIGWLKVRLGAEYLWEFAPDPNPTFQNDKHERGVAGSVQFVFAPYVEFGVNVGAAIIDVWDNNSHGQDFFASGNRASYGGFVDVVPAPAFLPNLMLGAGGNYATFHDLNLAGHDQSTNLQAFGAVQYLFYKQLFVKLVVGYAKSHFQNENTMTPYDDDQFSARVRLMYLY